MNDETQNELLSAYLDGEVTAAERDEVERLLAADPAVGRLLDQLRAVHAAIQELPPRKLGEDLSQQVLQAAERTPAVPLGQAVLRRMIDRRLLTWMAISAMVVAMITIHQRYLGPQQQAALEGREVARTAAPREESWGKTPPEGSLSAAPTAPREKKRAVASDMEAAPSKEAESADKLIITREPAEPSRFVRRMPKGAAKGQAVAKAAVAPQAITIAGAMIVRCDVTPEAAEHRAFDKLLDANGLVSHQQKKAKDSAEVTLEVEGTPAQIRAVLAGLQAQPRKFLAVSVEHPPSRTLDKAKAYGPTLSEAAPPPSDRGGLRLQNGNDAKGPQGEMPAAAPPILRQRVVFIVRIVAPHEPAP